MAESEVEIRLKRALVVILETMADFCAGKLVLRVGDKKIWIPRQPKENERRKEH